MEWFKNMRKNNFSTCISCKGDIQPNDKYMQCDTGYYVREGCDYRTCQYCKGTIANSEVAVSCPTGLGHYVHTKCRFGYCRICGQFIGENGVDYPVSWSTYRHRECKPVGPPTGFCML